MPTHLRWRLATCALGMIAGTLSAQVVHPIDMSKLQDASQFGFMAPALQGVEVVSLGESIHLTGEFPQVRVGMIRYLNEQLGFQVLGMEGTAEDIWVAQDRLLSSARGDNDVSEALGGLFSIWNTRDVRELLDYQVRSWSTSHPFYVAAYDIQPGTSRAFGGTEVFRQLAERLTRYSAPPAGVHEASLVSDLAPLTAACHSYTRDDSARVEHGVAAVAAWAASATPVVEARFTNVPHAAVLRLIAENLRASHRLCLGRLGEGWGRYKSVRDTNAAQYVVALKAVSPNSKLILWAHLSHLSHNSEGAGVSVGEILHRDLGRRLYTIMPFAEGGTVPLIYSDVNDDIAYGRVHGASTALGARLSSLSKTDYFLDLRSVANDSMFMSPQNLAVEATTMRLTLANDFDGIIWVKKVHAPHFADWKMSLLLAGFSVIHYRIGVLFVVAMIAVVVVARLLARRRRARVVA